MALTAAERMGRIVRAQEQIDDYRFTTVVENGCIPFVLVTKEDGTGEYAVSPYACTCEDYHWTIAKRGGPHDRCKHQLMVDSFLNSGLSLVEYDEVF